MQLQRFAVRQRDISAVVVAVALCGCARLGFEQPRDAAGAPVDARGHTDGTQGDRGGAGQDATIDVAGGDAAADGSVPSLCVEQPDPATVALYTFSGSGTTVKDVMDAHPGMLSGSGIQRVGVRPACGNSLDFSAASTGAHMLIPDSPAWDLKTGSIDFWMNGPPSAGVMEGVVTRDALGSALPGHLSIGVLCNGLLFVRLQTASADGLQCAASPSANKWHHIGVNFGAGGLELWVDGKRGTETAVVPCGGVDNLCGTTTAGGIDGNDNPWVIGAGSAHSAEGSALPVKDEFRGMIDSLRISNARRNYAATP